MKSVVVAIVLTLLLLPARDSEASLRILDDEAVYCAAVYEAAASDSTSVETAARYMQLSGSLTLGAEDRMGPGAIRSKIIKVKAGLNMTRQLGIKGAMEKGILFCNFFTGRLLDILQGRTTIEEHYQKYGRIPQLKF